MSAEIHKLDVPAAEPHNPDAEAAIIGNILADNGVFDRFAGTLKAEDFHVGLHAEMFTAIAALLGDGRPADLVTLAPVLRGKKVHEIDAESYVTGLLDYAPCTPEKLIGYVQEVLHYSARRGVMTASGTFGAQAARRDVKLIDAYDTAIKAFDEALARTQAQRITAKYGDEWAQDSFDTYHRSGKGIPTGLRDLDRLIGNLLPGELSVVGGRPSMGKSTCAAEIALNAALTRHGVLFESMEMGGESVAQRIMSSMCWEADSPIPYARFRRHELTEDQFVRLRAAKARLESAPLIINTQSAMTVAQVNSSARRAQLKLEARDTKLELIVIDYLGLMQMTARWDNRAYAIGEITSRLKDMAKTLDVHVMLLHQLNREVEKTQDKRPQLHHLRESGSIEQDADIVMFVYREEYYIEREGERDDRAKEDDRKTRLDAARGKMEIIVPKARNGPVGDATVGCAIHSNKLWDLQF